MRIAFLKPSDRPSESVVNVIPFRCSVATELANLTPMGSQVSQPVIVEQVRPGLYCCRWRMADSVRDFRCYANTFKLRGRCPASYSITATWIEKRYVVIIESAMENVGRNPLQSLSVCKDKDGLVNYPAVMEERKDLPRSVWMSYGGGQNQSLMESVTGTWRTDDFQFSTPLSQRVLPYRVMVGRPWAGVGLTFRLWLDFQATSRGEKTALRQLDETFIQQKRCDVQFLLGSQSIGAHVFVLSARSPVFAAMFQHNMRETDTKQVVISDIEPAVFKQLLHYIYAGRSPGLRLAEMAKPLLLAADKYDIEDLKEECLSLLRSQITVDNAIDTLIWAHYHSFKQLADVALLFVTQHGQDTCAGQYDLSEVSQTCPELSKYLNTVKQELMINNSTLCSC